MPGVLDVLDYSGGSGGSGTVEATWGNAYGHLIAQTEFVTPTGFTGTHTLGISWTGSPFEVFVIDASGGSTNITATGVYAVNTSSKIMFAIYSGASSTKSGTVTVVDNTAGGAAVDTFNYVATAP